MANSATPLMFIGSSREGIEFARAIQRHFANDPSPLVEAVVWDQDNFALNHSFLKSLDDIATKYDFGVFVLTPDDELTLRTIRYKAARDNVLFEYGLFVGRKGSERSFLLCPKDRASEPQFRLPSDLLGIHLPQYDSTLIDRADVAAGPACGIIRKRITAISSGAMKAPVNRLDRVVGQLEEAVRGLATTSLGRFPAFYSDINRMLRECLGPVRIACDFLTYGVFSSPDDYDKYLSQIEVKAKQGHSVSILFLNKEARNILLAHQIGKSEEDFRTLLNKQVFMEQLERCERRISRSLRSRTLFEAAVHEQQDRAVELFRRRANISVRTTGQSLPLLIWVSDERAVFSISQFAFGDYASEHGFLTRETSLVNALGLIWQQAWDAATPV